MAAKDKRRSATERLLRKILYSKLFDFNCIIQLIIYENTTAVFTYNDLLPLADLTLPLRRNSIETTTTSIPQHRNNSQPIAIVTTDPCIRKKYPETYFLPCVRRQLGEMLFFFFGSSNDLVQLILFILQHRLLVGMFFFAFSRNCTFSAISSFTSWR